MPQLTHDQAQLLISCVYRTLDLFAGAETDLAEWAKGLDSDAPAEQLMPTWFDAGSGGVLSRALYDCGVVRADGRVDRLRLLQFQGAVEFLPHFRAQELARRPTPKAQVVFTVPETVTLPTEAAHLRRSLAVRVTEALASAEDRALLASPYWSDTGAEKLWESLAAVRERGLAVTLAGAKRDPGAEYDHHAAMVRFARRLAADGARVRCLEFVAPAARSIFHAKMVCGAVGYLGSANMTDAALGAHVEAGVPLAEVDIERIWWLVDVLVDAGVLRELML